MKTTEEKIKICSTCTKREFQKSCGLMCSLTKAKPTFDDECIDYEADEKEIEYKKNLSEAILEEEKQEKVQKKLSTFFLFGLGGLLGNSLEEKLRSKFGMKGTILAFIILLILIILMFVFL